jgi:surfeit locus 1 family protein
VWQLGRGREKDRLAAELAARAEGAAVQISRTPVAEDSLRFRHVEARGTFVREHLVFLDNQARGPQPGYIVYMPLKLGDGPLHVLVKRGWVAAPLDRSVLPPVTTPDGEVTVDGLALAPNSRFLELSGQSADAGPVWQNVTVDRVSQATGLAFQPVVLEQHADLPDALLRDWPKPVAGSAKHYGYAFQWGAMATTILVLDVLFLVRRRRADAADPVRADA